MQSKMSINYQESLEIPTICKPYFPKEHKYNEFLKYLLFEAIYNFKYVILRYILNLFYRRYFPSSI